MLAFPGQIDALESRAGSPGRAQRLCSEGFSGVGVLEEEIGRPSDPGGRESSRSET
jgi:hypothetical protein